MFVIKDRPGVMPTKLMRHYFEGAMNQTGVFADRIHLDSSTEADGTLTYGDDMVQMLWVGWALGMRCAERIDREQRAQDVGIGPPQAA